MRLGLIADIHGNLESLDAVLVDLAQGQVDQIVCLGDVAALGPQPKDVVTRLRELKIPCVMGNTDAWVLHGMPAGRAAPDPDPVGDLVAWTADQLSPADVDFLRSFAPTLDVALGPGRSLLAMHGSPRSYDEVITAATPAADLAPMLADHQAEIVAGGHTHVHLLRRHAEVLIVNPGSVGLPGIGPGGPDLATNQHVRWAEYAVVDADEGRHSIDFRRIPINLDGLLSTVRDSGMPHADWWANLWDRS